MTKQIIQRIKNIPFDPRYGKKPEDRSIDELLDSGIIIIDKPMGPTSHQVSSWVRNMLGVKRAAHGGTLDPRVTGVLPIGVGTSVRAMEYIHDAGKKYVGIMRLHDDMDDQSLANIFKEFSDEIYQKPPVRAAVKRELRTRTIYALEIIERQERDILFRVSCQGGTYIRSLCVDIGEALAVGAHLQDLRRIEAGGFKESEAITLHELKDAVEHCREGKSAQLMKVLRPIEDIFFTWKKIVVKDSAVDALCHGASLAIPGIVELSKGIAVGDKVAIYTTKGEILGTANARLNTEQMINNKDGIAADLLRVFMKPDTYPRIWSSGEKRRM